MADVPADIATTLQRIYYGPGGFMGVADLAKRATLEVGRRVGMPVARRWLASQAVGQVYTQRPQPSAAFFDVVKPNDVHAADLLELPTDRGGFKYALNVVDVASRYKASKPLKQKTAPATKNAIVKIYNETPLDPPRRMLVDGGTEFKGAFAKYLKSNGTTVRVAQRGYHRGQAPVESFNRGLAVRLFKAQTADELATGRTSRAWVANLQPMVAAFNKLKNKRTGKTPEEAIAMDRVPLRRPKVKPERGPPIKLGDRVRVALEDDPQEAPKDRRRATDPNWSPQVREVVGITKKEDYPTLYEVDGIKHGLTRGRLLKI